MTDSDIKKIIGIYWENFCRAELKKILNELFGNNTENEFFKKIVEIDNSIKDLSKSVSEDINSLQCCIVDSIQKLTDEVKNHIVENIQRLTDEVNNQTTNITNAIAENQKQQIDAIKNLEEKIKKLINANNSVLKLAKESKPRKFDWKPAVSYVVMVLFVALSFVSIIASCQKSAQRLRYFDSYFFSLCENKFSLFIYFPKLFVYRCIQTPLMYNWASFKIHTVFT